MMMMMKNPVILVTCILLFSSIAVLASQNSFSPEQCCFQFYGQRLPKNKVERYRNTDNLCTMEGVIFTMRNGVEICTDPSVHWVKNLIKTMERK